MPDPSAPAPSAPDLSKRGASPEEAAAAGVRPEWFGFLPDLTLEEILSQQAVDDKRNAPPEERHLYDAAIRQPVEPEATIQQPATPVDTTATPGDAPRAHQPFTLDGFTDTIHFAGRTLGSQARALGTLTADQLSTVDLALVGQAHREVGELTEVIDRIRTRLANLLDVPTVPPARVLTVPRSGITAAAFARGDRARSNWLVTADMAEQLIRMHGLTPSKNSHISPRSMRPDTVAAVLRRGKVWKRTLNEIADIDTHIDLAGADMLVSIFAHVWPRGSSTPPGPLSGFAKLIIGMGGGVESGLDTDRLAGVLAAMAPWEDSRWLRSAYDAPVLSTMPGRAGGPQPSSRFRDAIPVSYDADGFLDSTGTPLVDRWIAAAASQRITTTGVAS